MHKNILLPQYLFYKCKSVLQNLLHVQKYFCTSKPQKITVKRKEHKLFFIKNNTTEFILITFILCMFVCVTEREREHINMLKIANFVHEKKF